MSSNHGRRYLVSKIQDGSQLTGCSNISETMTHIIKNSNGYHYIFGVSVSSSVTSDIVGCRCVLEIQDGSQVTGSSDNSETMIYTINIPTRTYAIRPQQTRRQCN